MPSTPLAPDQRALLASVGVAELPQPIPSGLLTLPIFRAAVKRGDADANGVLAESAWRAQVVVTEPAGRYTYYEITGDPKLGLPYGGDADVLLAMAALADRLDGEGRPHVNPVTGEFTAPSLRMLARVLDLDMTKERAERIKGALERLAAVRIRAARLRQLDDVAGRTDPVTLPAGNAHPIWLEARPGTGADGARPGRRPRVPHEIAAVLPGGEWVSEAEGTEFLITYAWRTEYHRTARGEDWISKLQINPALLDQGERGWVGWIDCPTHAKLTRPIAKRLYQLTANAQARQAPLRFELAALRQLCGIASGSAHVRTAHVRDDVVAAAQELVEHDVLAAAEVTSVTRGRYVFHFEPGLRLRVAGWLRGVGSPDLTEHRVLRLLLGSLDIAPKTAERLVTESAGQVRQMLAYVLYQRERGQLVRSPGRYVIDGVAGGWSYEGHDEFQRWLRERQADVRLAPRLARGPAGSDPLAGERGGRGGPASTVGGTRGSAAGGTLAGAGREGARPGQLRLDGSDPDAVDADGPVLDRGPSDGPPVPLPPLDAEVATWWAGAVAAAASQLHPLVRAYVERARPAVRSAVTLLVVAHTDGEAARLGRDAHVLADALAEVSAGAVCEVLVLTPQQWRARSADVDAVAEVAGLEPAPPPLAGPGSVVAIDAAAADDAAAPGATAAPRVAAARRRPRAG